MSSGIRNKKNRGNHDSGIHPHRVRPRARSHLRMDRAHRVGGMMEIWRDALASILLVLVVVQLFSMFRQFWELVLN